MKKNLPIIAIGCVLLIGLCVLLYPVASEIVSRLTQTATITSYQKAVEKLSDEDIQEMLTAAQDYNKNLYSAVLSDPFTDDEDVDESYAGLLSVDGALGYIEIPKIDVYLPIYYGSTPEVLEKGVGHLKNTSLPVGGASTHAVLTGHRGLPSATLFTDLDQLVDGDVFYIHIFDEVLAYKVNQIKVVEPEDTEDLTIVEGKDYVTLVTCTPYGINTQRLLIRAERTEYVPTEIHHQTALELVSEVFIVPTIFIIIAVLPITLLIRARIKRKARK